MSMSKTPNSHFDVFASHFLQTNWEEGIIQVDYLSGNYPGAINIGRNCPGDNHPRGNCPSTLKIGLNLSRGI